MKLKIIKKKNNFNCNNSNFIINSHFLFSNKKYNKKQSRKNKGRRTFKILLGNKNVYSK